MAGFVYFLCALTSILCAALLLRRGQVGLNFWCGICFSALALNNVLLFLDFITDPSIDLSIVRTIPAALAFGVMLWGLIWDLA